MKPEKCCQTKNASASIPVICIYQYLTRYTKSDVKPKDYAFISKTAISDAYFNTSDIKRKASTSISDMDVFLGLLETRRMMSNQKLPTSIWVILLNMISIHCLTRNLTSDVKPKASPYIPGMYIFDA
ncbi:hypothetical protein CDAR_400611 [Caerostris darwini]|uniref:Uncharacterized protein n=1 Tax=Caerostris darwini TaxID=1538125 RepID=A0AAV4S9W0_9ARAC|nr:hypothetical protein CDAR_400611 [Caerostris darwini]